MPYEVDAEDQSVIFDWGSAKPATGSRKRVFGDHFPVGEWLTYETTRLEKATDKKTGRVQIQLEARCVSEGPHKDLYLVDSFGFPLPSEADDTNKLYGASLFHKYMTSCGAAEIQTTAEVPLRAFAPHEADVKGPDGQPTGEKKLVPGRTFQAKAKDRNVKASDELDQETGLPKYPARVVSQVDDMRRVPKTAAPAAPATAPAPAPVAQAPAPAEQPAPAPAPAPTPAPAPATAPVSQIADSLFDS